MDWGSIAGLVLGGGGVGKMLYDVLKARGDARKVNADAATTLINAATESATEYAADLAEVRKEVRELRTEQRKQDERITAHLRWDRQVAEQLRELGGTVPDPPPLYGEAA